MRNSTGGAYLLLLCIARPLEVEVGKLGKVRLGPGLYGYVGSAIRGLIPRISRHCTKEKRARWHIDYLTARHDVVVYGALVFKSKTRAEAFLAEEVARIAKPSAKGFGSSDTRDTTHLFELDVGGLRALCERLGLVFIGCRTFAEGSCSSATLSAVDCRRSG